MSKRVYVYWVEGKKGHKIVLSHKKKHQEGIDIIPYPSTNWIFGLLQSHPFGNMHYGGFQNIQYPDNSYNTISVPRYLYPIADFIPTLAGDDIKSTQVDAGTDGRR